MKLVAGLAILSLCLLCSCAAVQELLTDDTEMLSSGKYSYDLIRSAVDTSNLYGYAQSTDRIPRLKIEAVAVQPQEASSGQSVNLVMSYAVLSPDDQLVTISELRDLYFGDSRLWASANSVDRSAGSYRSAVTFSVPANMPKGIYRARFALQTIPAGLAPDIQEVSFSIR